MSTLPLIFRGDKLRALVVGGGTIALRKVQDLLDVGAEITIIAPQVEPEIREIVEQNRKVRLIERLFCVGDTRLRKHKHPKLRAFNLIIAATDDTHTNSAISEEAQAEGIPVNVVDVPELCTVYFAAVARREPLLVAVSTGGHAPFLAKRLKHEAERFADEWALRARWSSHFRDWVRENVGEFEDRERMYERFLELPDDELKQWDEQHPPLDMWREWI